MKTYRKTATVQSKIFEEGDEDGFINPQGMILLQFQSIEVPFIKTLKNTHHIGEFGKHYLCVGVDGERWLVEKSIFERTYELYI